MKKDILILNSPSRDAISILHPNTRQWSGWHQKVEDAVQDFFKRYITDSNSNYKNLESAISFFSDPKVGTNIEAVVDRDQLSNLKQELPELFI